MVRGQQVKREQITLPDLDSFGYLFEIMNDLGYSKGREPLTWQEIRAFQEVTGTPLSLWEAKAIKRASHAYVNAVIRYDGSGEMSPLDELNREKVDVGNRLKAALRIINEQRKKR